MLKDDSGCGSPLTVLLVEQDSSVARLVMTALRMEGYLVIGPVASAHEALEVVRTERPDLILLDGRMIPRDEFDVQPPTAQQRPSAAA